MTTPDSSLDPIFEPLQLGNLPIPDPIEQAERVYDAFDLELTGRARDRMSAFVKSNSHSQGPKAASFSSDWHSRSSRLRKLS
jgi:hypothetical protein